jgi:ATP-binding cassette, subfamily B, bacterial PglK
VLEVTGVSNRSLIGLLRQLWSSLQVRRRRQFVAVLMLMVVSALLEVASLGAVLPFLVILTSPGRIFNNRLVAHLAHDAGIVSPEQLLLPLTVVFATMALLVGAIRMILVWASTRFAFAAGADLSNEIYRRTLHKPYQLHLQRNSSEVISGITSKVGGAVLGVLLPLMTFISSTMLLATIPMVLILIDPIVAISATVGFGGSYALISWISRRRLARNSRRIADQQSRVLQALQEGLGGIRDVLLDGSQLFFCELYGRADQSARRAQGNNVFISQSPRYAMEAISMVLIALLAYEMTRQGSTNALPVLGVLALGAQRLLPALQQSFAAWATIVGNQAYLADTIELFEQPIAPELLLPAPMPLAFRSSIEFRSVRFRYSNETPWVLNGLTFEIKKGTRVGIVGATGSGKSTTLDLLMGLLRPTDGQVCVDGEFIEGMRARSWQRTIAHVPQTVYLADSSLAANIAFGIPREAIDLERVRDAARRAQIADFIEGRPGGYEVMVGERGVRLSGGQRQRIGIARALYKRASVLVLDEATSALDNATEQSVMEAIENFDRSLTILIIAHRLTTVRHCDTIIELDHGRVVAQAPYEKLLQCSQSFRQMAQIAQIARST